MDIPHPLPGKATSLWLDTAPAEPFPALTQPVAVDVVVIGGGIAGITAASLLKAEGRTVALIDAGRLLQGVTGQTTAKLTSQHTLIYSHLLQRFGEARARAYADANQTAVELVARTVQEQGIDCDFAHTEAYTWAESAAEADQLRRELEAAQRLGLPARWVDRVPLPFPAQAALCFDRQAQLHPVKYLQHLARAIPGAGSHVFENTCAVKVDEGEPCLVLTRQGSIRARDVILATHYPFTDHSLYALRLHPHRGYVLAARLDGPAPAGMFINVQRNRSLRPYASDAGSGVLVVGEGHPVGEGGDTQERYRRLEAWAHEVLPVAGIDYHWSTHDHHTIDHVPYIGRANPFTRHVYVATGFGGWGMSNGTVAGLLLRDLVLGRENPWTEVFEPSRVNLAGTRDFARLTFTIGKHWVGDRLRRPEAALAPGEGRVVATAQGRLALYKDETGDVHALSSACTHMGCVVQWNGAEKSWDCPCHGSRFDAIDGHVLHGPALDALERRTLDLAGTVRQAG
jgi:glycine/D-amino acid oxidase-like deaminating enzyme/nitrite reductase/ring-hydroxylating ferredoxin subunit